MPTNGTDSDLPPVIAAFEGVLRQLKVVARRARKGRAPAVSQRPAQPRADAFHSPDFRSVNWFGETHYFTPTQAAIVAILWGAWEGGAPDVGQETLLRRASADTHRLRDVFKTARGVHPAWGTMIKPGATKGAYRLQEPAAA
jgi:hypothetical protein